MMLCLTLITASLISFSFVACQSLGQHFDAFFPNNPRDLSYLKADDNFTLPDNVVNLTLCFWLKPSAKTEMSVLSYNTYPSTRWGNPLGWYVTPDLNKSWLCIHENCIEMAAPIMQINIWHHFCVLYDGTNPKVTLIYNGEEKFETTGSPDLKNKKIKGGGIIVLGQDQDKYGGGFDAKQSVRGKLSRLQMWDRVLDQKEVYLQTQCTSSEGNLIAWSKTPWTFLNGATKVSAEPCIPLTGVQEVTTTVQTDLSTEESCKLSCFDVTSIHTKVEEQEAKFELREKLLTEITKSVTSLKEAEDVIQTELDFLNEKYTAVMKKFVARKEEKTKHENDVGSLNTHRIITMEEDGRSGDVQNTNEFSETMKKSCPKKFVEVDGRCYFFSAFVLNDWNEARMACKSLSSQSALISLESKEEWLSLQQYLGENNMHKHFWWTSATDASKEGRWMWQGTNETADFLPWCKDEPSGGRNENCLHLREINESWCYNDLPCQNPGTHFSTKFICEIDPLYK